MKIGIVSVFPPFRGGIARFNTHMVRGLRAAGHEVVPVNYSRQYPSLLFPGKSQYDRLQTSEEMPALLDSIGPKSWKATAKYLKSQAVDWVILPYWTGYLAPSLSGVARNLTGTRVTGLLHNATPHDAGNLQRFLSRQFFNSCTDFVTLSDAVTADVKRRKGDAEVKTLFHPIYDDGGRTVPVSRADARQALGIDQNKRVLLFFGLIRPYKGLDILLDAFNGLDERYHLIVAGEPYIDLAPLRNIPSPSAKARITWLTRYINDSELPELFGATDAVVLPYRSATQSGVTAHAIHYQRPVIASRVGGLEEYILEGLTGRFADAGSVDSLALAIEAWFSSERSEQSLTNAFHELNERMGWQRFSSLLTAT